jgi:hypothetical protein
MISLQSLVTSCPVASAQWQNTSLNVFKLRVRDQPPGTTREKYSVCFRYKFAIENSVLLKNINIKFFSELQKNLKFF